MEMLLKMNQENGQVGSGLAQIYLLGGTFGFWKRGISSYSGANIQKNGHSLALIMSYPSARRMGRALSALALPYSLGGSMGA